MIHGIFIINNHGKARLIKVYNKVVRDLCCPAEAFCTPLTAGCCTLQSSDTQKLVRELFLMVSKRPDNVCNFLEGGRYVYGEQSWLPHSSHTDV